MPYIAVRSVAPLTEGNQGAFSYVGHAWVEISGSQVSPDGKPESYGFYPESLSPYAAGEVRHSDYDLYVGHGFSSQQFYVTEDQAQYVRLFALQADAGTYSILPGIIGPLNNCASFAFEAMSRAGVTAILPIRNILPWFMPAQFDEDMHIKSAVATAFQWHKGIILVWGRADFQAAIIHFAKPCPS